MAPARVFVLGCGIRGRTYAAYAVSHPEEFTLAGVADPVAGLPEGAKCPLWKSWEEAFSSGVKADAAVISLPDALHLAATKAALERGMHVLLEKPLGCSWKECEEIRELSRRSGRLVLAGFVLRYAPFYRKLREVLFSGEIGELVSIHHLVAVSCPKAAHAFCRGNWSVEAEGTGMLVNKCSHDFDLIEWWTGAKRCRKISSFGSLKHWRSECRPEGAADRCVDCPDEIRLSCPFDAVKIYCGSSDMRYHFADESDAAMEEVVRSSPYGRCVYACGNDSVDHQTVLMEYEGGLTVTLEMESYTKERRRLTRFFGTRGEIEADEKTITVKPFLGEERTIEPESRGAHGGGDSGIMAQFAFLARSASPERYGKILEAALESHRLAFLAEDSRKEGKTIET